MTARHSRPDDHEVQRQVYRNKCFKSSQHQIKTNNVSLDTKMMQLKKKHSEVVYNKNKFPLAFNCNTDACQHSQNRMDAVRRKPTFTIFTAFCCNLQMIVNTLPTYSPTGFVTFRNYGVKCIVIATGIENWPGQKKWNKK